MTTTRPALILDPTHAELNRMVLALSNRPDVAAHGQAAAARDRRGAELILQAAPAPALPCLARRGARKPTGRTAGTSTTGS